MSSKNSTANPGLLSLDDKIIAEDELIKSLSHAGDRKIISWSVVGAILIHAIFFFAHFPSFKKTILPQKEKDIIEVKKYIPPPPKIERKQIVKKKITKKVPIPDPTPEEPEPIREPEPEIEDVPIPPDVDFLIGDPVPPPVIGPLLAGTGGVTDPVLLTEGKPEYPEIARVSRLEGNVILQAIIHTDGTVGALQILRCSQPNMGFEEAAIAAVQEWRYEPATQDGRPVEVYFTVFVEFALH